MQSDSGLRELLNARQQADCVALDTEFMRRDTFYPQAALLQLCFPGDNHAWLIDPLSLEDSSPLQELLENSAITKVLHSPGEDFKVLQHWLRVLPGPVFDTQRAAAYLNLGHGLGYRALVKLLTGECLPKGETRSNWLARPLTKSQLRYAAQDVIPLVNVYQALYTRLVAQNKLGWLQQDSEAAIAAAHEVLVAPASRIKSAWKLNSSQLAVLMGVCQWRENRAKSTDKPLGWILSDSHCLQLAQNPPGALEDFRKIEDFPQAVIRNQGEQLLQWVDAALSLQQAELPPRLPVPLDAVQRKQLKWLRKSARRFAQEWDIAPEILLASKDYELLLRKFSGEQVVEPGYWSGWRKQALLQPLQQEFEANAA